VTEDTEPMVVRFGDGQGALQFSLVTRPFPDAAAEWDRDAISVEILGEKGGMRCAFATTMWSHELALLERLLERLSDQSTAADISFRCREGVVELDLKLDNLGHLACEVRLNPSAQLG
jgi:hypothetical protein